MNLRYEYGETKHLVYSGNKRIATIDNYCNMKYNVCLHFCSDYWFDLNSLEDAKKFVEAAFKEWVEGAGLEIKK
jgi:hypothetical protein